jgi:hypothetical protein
MNAFIRTLFFLSCDFFKFFLKTPSSKSNRLKPVSKAQKRLECHPVKQMLWGPIWQSARLSIQAKQFA